MDNQKLSQIAALIDNLIGDNEPSDEDLNYDDDAIQVYADLHNLKESLRKLGF